MFFGAIAQLITGYIGVQKEWSVKNAWFKLAMSIFGSSFVTFFFVMGTTTGGMILNGSNPWVALIGGFAAGCTTMACAVVWLWKSSELTKGIPIAYPMKLEEEVMKTLQEQGFVVTKPKEK